MDLSDVGLDDFWLDEQALRAFDSVLMWFMWIFVILILFCVFSSKAKYYFKFFFFFLGIVVAGSLGTFRALKEGKSTNTFFFCFGWFSIVYKWMGLEFIIRGSEHLDTDESVIVVANHQSSLDVYTMTKIYPRNCSVILKSSLRFVPVFNWMTYLADAIFIDRFTKEKSKYSLHLALEKIKKFKRKIFLFPEGTRNSKKELLPFKKGAFILSKEADVSVVPVVFSRYNRFLNHQETRWDYGGKIIIQVLPPMDPKDFASLEAMSDECRTKMENELDRLDEELGNIS